MRPCYDNIVSQITQLLWDEANIAHVASHGVTMGEVEEVIDDAKAVFLTSDSHRPGRIEAWGRTTSGRLLLVVLDAPTSNGHAYVVTARPMTVREKRDFEGDTNGQD